MKKRDAVRRERECWQYTSSHRKVRRTAEWKRELTVHPWNPRSGHDSRQVCSENDETGETVDIQTAAKQAGTAFLCSVTQRYLRKEARLWLGLCCLLPRIVAQWSMMPRHAPPRRAH